MRYRLALLLTVLAVVAAACGNADTTATGAGGETEAQAPATEAPEDATDPDETADDGEGTAGEVTVAVESSDLGEILVDGEGRTLYLFVPDDQGESTCYDDCEQNWPPLTGSADAGAGAEAAQLDTVDRDDGTQQVTYNGWPLYYFAADSQPGDVNGQGVGDVWFAVSPAGEAVREEAGDDESTSSY